MSSSNVPVILCILVPAIALFLHFRRRKANQFPLPPGPKKLPFVGNALSLPRGFEYKTYAKWGKELNSELIHLDAFGKSIVILNSARVATELLDKRANLYSGRPNFVMLNDIMEYGWMTLVLPYGEAWRARRGLFHREFNAGMTARYQPQTISVVRERLHLFLDSPANFPDHMRGLIGAQAMMLAYGIKVKRHDDPYLNLAEDAIDGFNAAAVPGRFLVDILPFLKYVPDWMPGAGFKKLGKKWKKSNDDAKDLPFSECKRIIASGSSEPSFTSYCLQNVKGGDLSRQETVICESAGNFFMAAVDSTEATLNTFVLAMVCYPEVQAKAQEELDRVLTPGHLPDFSDEASLPYISAMVKELIRWHAVVPMGVPHYLDVDDVFEGYHIPAKSIVVANSWAMLHDETTYPEPFEFKPERFLKDGKLDPDAREPTPAFGFGRRACPGRHVSVALAWCTIGSMLATFNIEKARDENGVEIVPSKEFLSSVVSRPVPFKCSIKPRSREAETLIRSAATL